MPALIPLAIVSSPAFAADRPSLTVPIALCDLGGTAYGQLYRLPHGELALLCQNNVSSPDDVRVSVRVGLVRAQHDGRWTSYEELESLVAEPNTIVGPRLTQWYIENAEPESTSWIPFVPLRAGYYDRESGRTHPWGPELPYLPPTLTPSVPTIPSVIVPSHEEPGKYCTVSVRRTWAPQGGTLVTNCGRELVVVDQSPSLALIAVMAVGDARQVFYEADKKLMRADLPSSVGGWTTAQVADLDHRYLKAVFSTGVGTSVVLVSSWRSAKWPRDRWHLLRADGDGALVECRAWARHAGRAVEVASVPGRAEFFLVSSGRHHLVFERVDHECHRRVLARLRVRNDGPAIQVVSAEVGASPDLPPGELGPSPGPQPGELDATMQLCAAYAFRPFEDPTDESDGRIWVVCLESGLD